MNDKRPFDFLNSSVTKNVIVGLKEGHIVRGLMLSYDVHMNIVLEKAEMLSETGEVKRGLGKVLLRGDSIIYVSLSE